MPTLEEILRRGRFCHSSRYRRKPSLSSLHQNRKKLLAYQDAGIPAYWIVDVAAKVVRIHRLNQAKTYSEETHSKDSIALQAFPDVTIDLGKLF